jgi:cyanophycinase
MKKHLLLILLISSIILFSTASAQTAPGLLIPMGGGYADLYNSLMQTIVQNSSDGQISILVLPSAYTTNPNQITPGERQTNLTDAERRRYETEEACKRAAPAGITCSAIIAPIFTRADAAQSENLALLTDNLSAVFILGGDQTTAMQALANTPFETRLSELHQRGLIIAGTSAGGGMQSVSMLAGYNPNYARENALFFGAADVWNTPEKRGLPFSLQNAILDQHFHQRARMGRLLNAILRPDTPNLGIGVDGYTGVITDNETLRDVFGLYTVTVLDAETYHAAAGLRYISIPQSQTPLLSARNIIVSLLSPGNFSYDLKNRVAQFNQTRHQPPPTIERQFDALTLPTGAGALILSGDISGSIENNPILQRFIEISGGKNANLLVFADGGANDAANQRTAQRYVDALVKMGASAQTGNATTDPANLTGILYIGRDASKMTPPEWLKERWLTGTPLLADNAAATLLGAHYAAHPTTPAGGEEEEAATQQSFWQGKTQIQPGLGLVNITMQPQLLADNRFGRWFSLAYNRPDLLAIGLNKDTAIEISHNGTQVVGQNAIFVLDLRAALLETGSNNGFVIANGLLDIFAPGEPLVPEIADINADYVPQPMPQLPTATAQAQPSPTPEPATITTTQSEGQNKPGVNPIRPPAQAFPPLWGLAIGLILVIGAGLVARLLKNRR